MRMAIARRSLVFVGMLVAVPSLCATGDNPPDRIDKLRQWLSAVSHHEAGTQDDVVFEIAAFSSTDLQLLIIDAQSLVTLIRNPRAPILFVKSGQTQRQVPYTGTQIKRLRDLAA